MNSMGRNDPCYCGSGKKYKKCHMLVESAARTDRDPRYEAFRSMRNAADEEVLRVLPNLIAQNEVERFLHSYDSPPFLSPRQRKRLLEDDDALEHIESHEPVVLLRAWRTDSGENLGALAVERYPSRFTAEQKDYLLSEGRNLVTFVQAREFFPEEGTILAEDVLDGEVYRIFDYAMARNPMPHAIVAGRLVPYPHGQGFVMDPLGQTVFEPREKDDLITAVAGMIKRPGLRGAELKKVLQVQPLVFYWSALWKFHRWLERPAPVLVNRDGTPFAPPRKKSASKSGAVPRPPDFPLEVLQQIGRQMFEKWMRETLDSPVPALGDLSPRACCATVEGRRKVRAWIDDYEHDLSRKVEDPVMGAFDMDEVRRQLGLMAP